MKIIPLTQGKTCSVDDADYRWLSRFRWFAAFDGYNWYAVTKLNGKSVGMHRLLCAISDPKIKVDHHDHNGLNNQRENLRVCTHQQNSRNMGLRRKLNKSGYKGVSWKKKNNKWVAQIKVGPEVRYLGLFSDPRDAALAYDRVAIAEFGDFAATNQQLGLL